MRAARPADAAAASSLARQAKAGWGYPDAWLEIWREQLTITPAYLETCPAWCAEADGELAGFCALESVEEGWELGHLWVRPSHQGMGTGQRLMERAAEALRARGVTALRITSDPGAEGFYRRLGAQPAGEVAAPMPGAPGRALPVLLLRI